jgi:hypothetical protein
MEYVNQLMKCLHRMRKRFLQNSDAELGLRGEDERVHLVHFLRRFGEEVLRSGEGMGVDEPDMYNFAMGLGLSLMEPGRQN